MKIAVLGAGGVGGYFGGLLAHAGHDVTFLARGDHLQAMREHGLQVKSVNGDFAIIPCQATDRPEEVGPVQYVLVAVKHYQLEGAAPSLLPLIGEGTTVAPLLNGIDAPRVLSQVVGEEHVVGGFCSLVSMVESPGIIHQKSSLRRIVIGELDRRPSERVEKLVQALDATGVEALHADDIWAAMWTKLLFIASFGGVTSLARTDAGGILSSPETRAVFIRAMEEVEHVGHARGVDLEEDAVQSALALAEAFEPEATSSMQRDVAAGNLFELEAFSGTIVRAGREEGVSTPIHETIYALLLPALITAQTKEGVSS